MKKPFYLLLAGILIISMGSAYKKINSKNSNEIYKDCACSSCDSCESDKDKK